MPLIQSFPPVDGQTVQAEVLPTAGASQLNKIYQYVGTTTPQYVNGYFYKCIYNNPNYEWVNVLVQPEADPDPSVILTGTILANGWNNNAQTVTVNDFDSSIPGTIGLLNTVTGEQYAAAANAGLRVTAIANNSVTFSCEETPEIDIPFGILIPGTTVNGGGGTTDYTYLDNKPQIANVTLQGNKSLADLGIAGASDVEAALDTKVGKVAGKGLSTNDYTNEDKAIVGGVTSALAGKQDTISDLTTIRSGAGAGATAVQPSATEGLLKNDGTVDTVTKASQAAVNAILNGTSIDSFGDVETALANKVDAVAGKGLSTNDYSDTEKNKVANNTEATKAITNVYSSKNLLDNPFRNQTSTLGTLTATVSDDGSFRVTGTALSANAPILSWVITLPKGDYIISRGSADSSIIGFRVRTSTAQKLVDDVFAEEAEFSLSGETILQVAFLIAGNSGSVDVTVYPMIRDARITDKTFVSYAKTNKQLTDEIANKVDKVEGKGLSTNDFDNTYKSYATIAYNMNRRTRNNITSNLTNLSTAVSEQNLAKYGYSIGDYFTGASGYTYILADCNTFKGTTTPYCISTNHIGIVVYTNTTSQWHTENAAAVGYNGSTLHTYLKTTVLDNIKADFKALFGGSTGLEHLIAHSKLLTTATANWAWALDQYISALTCTQVDAGSQWTANGFQEGEASKSLEVFRKYKWTEIFGGEYLWLRNISNYDNSSASFACLMAGYGGLVGDGSVTGRLSVVGLINFH